MNPIEKFTKVYRKAFGFSKDEKISVFTFMNPDNELLILKFLEPVQLSISFVADIPAPQMTKKGKANGNTYCGALPGEWEKKGKVQPHPGFIYYSGTPEQLAHQNTFNRILCRICENDFKRFRNQTEATIDLMNAVVQEVEKTSDHLRRGNLSNVTGSLISISDQKESIQKWSTDLSYSNSTETVPILRSNYKRRKMTVRHKKPQGFKISLNRTSNFIHSADDLDKYLKEAFPTEFHKIMISLEHFARTKNAGRLNDITFNFKDLCRLVYVTDRPNMEQQEKVLAFIAQAQMANIHIEGQYRDRKGRLAPEEWLFYPVLVTNLKYKHGDTAQKIPETITLSLWTGLKQDEFKKNLGWEAETIFRLRPALVKLYELLRRAEIHHIRTKAKTWKCETVLLMQAAGLKQSYTTRPSRALHQLKSKFAELQIRGVLGEMVSIDREYVVFKKSPKPNPKALNNETVKRIHS